jgi:hypothetical protein
MAQPITLTVSGAGIAMAQVPPSLGFGQIVGIVAKPGVTDALNVTLYSCPSYSTSAIPAGSTTLGSFSAPASGVSPTLSLSPDGIAVAGYIAAQFTDADTAHVVYVYVK